MHKSVPKIFDRVMPFLIMGFTVAFLIAALVFLSYILLWGVLIGLVLFAINYIRQRFFAKADNGEQSGRIIEHDDL